MTLDLEHEMARSERALGTKRYMQAWAEFWFGLLCMFGCIAFVAWVVVAFGEWIRD